jgi:hypothetical protein
MASRDDIENVYLLLRAAVERLAAKGLEEI